MSRESSATGPVSRIVLILGVVIAAVGFAALLLTLGLYFAEIIPHAALYWVMLWGLPVGFALMCIAMMLNLRRRRRYSAA